MVGTTNATLLDTSALIRYVPNANYNGNAGVSGGCTQLIGYTIKFNGTSDFELDCTGAGTKPIEVGGTVVLAE